MSKLGSLYRRERLTAAAERNGASGAARFERKTKLVPENGSWRSCSRTSTARPSAPLRKSTGFVATILWRDDMRFIDLDEPKMVLPIIMSHRKNDTSALLQQLVKLVREFDEWDASVG